MKIELGRKHDETAIASPSSDKRTYYPSLHLEMKSKSSKVEIGKTVKAVVELKLVSESQNISDDGKRVSCTYDVISVDFDYENEDKD